MRNLNLMNISAIRCYVKFGFVEEGRQIRQVKMNDQMEVGYTFLTLEKQKNIICQNLINTF